EARGARAEGWRQETQVEVGKSGRTGTARGPAPHVQRAEGRDPAARGAREVPAERAGGLQPGFRRVARGVPEGIREICREGALRDPTLTRRDTVPSRVAHGSGGRIVAVRGGSFFA